MGRINAEQRLERDRRIFAYLQNVIGRGGVSPSVREICAHCAVNSTSAVCRSLERLAEQGLIRQECVNNRTAARTIRLGSPDETAPPAGTVSIPLLGAVAAGKPIFADGAVEEWLPLSVPQSCDPTELFALRIKGESMREAGILNGDTVVVQRTGAVQNGEIVIALLDDEATCKTIYREAGRVRLQPQNHEMEPIYAKEVTVLGRVIACIRTYRSIS